ncbi:MAG TPA: rod shape-determining protein MreC [Gammaproteobacteria bacterium]|nr:rod shape-determining protein MreC [Gammaproteobacteria bacterium]
MKPIFGQNTANRYRLVLFSVISFALIFLDHRFDFMDPVRFTLSVVTAPVQYVANIPAQVASWSHSSVRSRSELEEENARLQSEVLVLKRRVQKLASTVAENTRLKELMNASDLVADEVLIGEIIGVDPDPYRHEAIVNKGAGDAVFVGQAVLDAEGLMGQVIEVGPFSSRVLLISDISHGIPVHVNRNGVRAIAVGSGKLDQLKLIHVPDTADIVRGDLLVSSGLGGRFPKGYPVGVVTMVEHDPGQPFALVDAKPMANLDRSRHVLLVFSEESRKLIPLLSGVEAAQQDPAQSAPADPDAAETEGSDETPAANQEAADGE